MIQLIWIVWEVSVPRLHCSGHKFIHSLYIWQVSVPHLLRICASLFCNISSFFAIFQVFFCNISSFLQHFKIELCMSISFTWCSINLKYISWSKHLYSMHKRQKSTELWACLFKRRLVAFKGGFVGLSVCSQKFFTKFWKRGFVNQIDMKLDSTYE